MTGKIFYTNGVEQKNYLTKIDLLLLKIVLNPISHFCFTFRYCISVSVIHILAVLCGKCWNRCYILLVSNTNSYSKKVTYVVFMTTQNKVYLISSRPQAIIFKSLIVLSTKNPLDLKGNSTTKTLNTFGYHNLSKKVHLYALGF